MTRSVPLWKINCVVCPYGHSEGLSLCGKVPPTTLGLALNLLTLAIIILSVNRGSQSSGRIEHDRCFRCVRLPASKIHQCKLLEPIRNSARYPDVDECGVEVYLSKIIDLVRSFTRITNNVTQLSPA